MIKSVSLHGLALFLFYLHNYYVNRNTPHKIVNNPTLEQTLSAMREAAYAGRRDLSVRRLVEKICEELQPGDYNSEILAIYYWVCANIRYIRDPYDVEFVKAPWRLIEARAGDCDDITTLLSSMFMLCGNKVRFAVVAFEKGEWSHVYCQVNSGGKWITVDPVANEDTDRMHQRISKARYLHL